MKVKTLITAATCSWITVNSVVAQNTKLQVPALIVDAVEGKSVHSDLVMVEKVSGGIIWYRLNARAAKINDKKMSSVSAVYLARPKDLILAVELFENRQYEAALKAFRGVKSKFKNFTGIDNSFPAIAGFYELACLRKLKQYEKLAKAEPLFADSKWLTKESDQDQLKIYKLWTHLADKAYPKVIKEYENVWRVKKLPNSLRAQVEYLYGKAQEAQGNAEEALIAYSKAMNADFSGSEVLTLEAIEASFNLIEADAEAQEIRQMWDNGETKLLKPKLNTSPYIRLLEASALVRVHNKLGLSGYDSAGLIVELPEKYNKYLKYTKESAEALAK